MGTENMNKMLRFSMVAVIISSASMMTAQADGEARILDSTCSPKFPLPLSAQCVRDLGVNAFYILDWSELTPKAQRNWGVLGWEETNWNSDPPAGYPQSECKLFPELTKPEQKAAKQLGYKKASWNVDESSCCCEFYDLCGG